MKFSMLCAVALAVFANVQAEEIKFDENLTGWTKSFSAGIGFDAAEKVSPAGSMRLTGNPARPNMNATRALELEPNKKYELTVMVKGENIADKRSGLFIKVKESWYRFARWEGTFGWTRCTAILDTGKMGGGKGTLHITLFGKSGKLWIDRLTIVPLKEAAGKAATGAQAAAGQTAGIYPNPDYLMWKNKAGKPVLRNCWMNGTVAPAGTHDGRPAIRLKPVYLKTWNNFVGSIGIPSMSSMEPGKYTFSVWCCPETGVKQFGIFFGRTPAETKKNVSQFRKYMPFEMPKEGEWTEMAINFEVKPGDTKLNFFYCFTGSENSSALFADPKIVREEDAE